jgi:uncharacterized protein YegL
MRTSFKGQIHARLQGRSTIAFANLQNALEDVWINEKEARESPTAHQRIENSRLAYVPESVVSIEQQPKLRQLGLNILHYWFFGENIPTLTDKDVLKTFEEIKPFLPEYFYGSDPESNYKVLRDKIYPLVVPLEEKDIQQRAELSSMPRGSGGSQASGDPGQGGKNKPSGVGKGLEAIKNGIRSFFGLSKTNGGGGSGQTAGQPQPGSSENSQGGASGQPQQSSAGSSQNASPGGAEGGLPGVGGLRQPSAGASSGQTAGQPQPGSSENSQGGASGQPQQNSAGSAQGASPGGAEGSLPGVGQASVAPTPEQLEEARRTFESLPEAEKKRLLEEAKKWLEGEIAKKLKGELPGGLTVKQDPKTGEFRVVPQEGLSGKELKNAQARAAKAEAEPSPPSPGTEPSESTSPTVAPEALGFAEGEASDAQEYRTIEGQCRSAVNHFKRVIQANAPKADEDVFSGAFMTGAKIDNRRLAQNRVAGTIYQRLDAAKLEQPNLACGLVLDNSSSMAGDRLEGSRVGAVALARVTRSLGIPFCITLFDSAAGTLKSPSQDFDDPRQRIKPKLMRNFDASGGGTNIGLGLEKCMDEVKPLLTRDRELRALIFLVSDSGANEGKTGSALADYVKSLGSRVRVVNFIFGGSQREIKEARAIFGDRFVVPVEDASQFGVLASEKLAQILRSLKSGG